MADDQEAQEHYLQALALDPQLEESLYFGQTDLRAQTLLEYVPIVDPQSSNSLAWAGWRALNANDLEKAEENLNAALEIDFNNANAYAWLGRLNLALGAQDQAWEEIQIALLLGDDSPIVRTEASRITQEKGEDQESMDHLLRAYELLTNENQSFEFASVFYMRLLLPFDFVPQVHIPKLSNSAIEEFASLAAHMKGLGMVDIADEITIWIHNSHDIRSQN